MNTDASSVSWDFIRICLGTVARYAIFMAFLFFGLLILERLAIIPL